MEILKLKPLPYHPPPVLQEQYGAHHNLKGHKAGVIWKKHLIYQLPEMFPRVYSGNGKGESKRKRDADTAPPHTLPSPPKRGRREQGKKNGHYLGEARGKDEQRPDIQKMNMTPRKNANTITGKERRKREKGRKGKTLSDERSKTGIT